MTAYPAIAPTSLRLRPAGWPVHQNRFRGVEAPALLGSLAADSKLELDYQNIADNTALLFLEAWRKTAGGLNGLTTPLPAQVASGVAGSFMQSQILAPAGLTWAFAEEPRMEAVKAGRRTVSVVLRAEFRWQ